jgi:hypothetical protein
MATASSSRPRQIGQMVMLGVGVVLIGLVIGTYVVAPTADAEQRRTALLALGAASMLLAMGVAVRALWTRATTWRARRSPRSSAATGGAVIRLAGSRTPHAVHTLAAAGAAPTEIAWKTRLPVDAVRLLLQMDGAR